MVTSGKRTQRHHEASLKAWVREVHHQMNFNANFDEVGGLINVVLTLQKSNKFENGIPTVIKAFPAHIW